MNKVPDYYNVTSDNREITTEFYNLTPETTEIETFYVTQLDVYLPPILIIVGTICNILVIKVMRSVYFRHVSTSFFIFLTACLDIFSFNVLLSVHWISLNFPYSIYRGAHAHIMCKFFNFFGWATSDLGILLVVGMTTERVVAILLPMKAHKVCTVQRAKKICLIIICIIVFKDGHFAFTSDITPASRNDLLCYVASSNKAYMIFYNEYWTWIHNGFIVIAFIIIMICNCIIIKHIRASDKMYNNKLSAVKSPDEKKNSTNRKRGYMRRRQMALLLLAASFAIIICTLPFSIFLTLDINLDFLNDSLSEKHIKHLISSICFYLLYLNRTCNFFLYCISGARFRKALKIICNCNKEDDKIMSDNQDRTSRHSTARTDRASRYSLSYNNDRSSMFSTSTSKGPTSKTSSKCSTSDSKDNVFDSKDPIFKSSSSENTTGIYKYKSSYSNERVPNAIPRETSSVFVVSEAIEQTKHAIPNESFIYEFTTKL